MSKSRVKKMDVITYIRYAITLGCKGIVTMAHFFKAKLMLFLIIFMNKNQI